MMLRTRVGKIGVLFLSVALFAVVTVLTWAYGAAATDEDTREIGAAVLGAKVVGEEPMMALYFRNFSSLGTEELLAAYESELDLYFTADAPARTAYAAKYASFLQDGLPGTIAWEDISYSCQMREIKADASGQKALAAVAVTMCIAGEGGGERVSTPRAPVHLMAALVKEGGAWKVARLSCLRDGGGPVWPRAMAWTSWGGAMAGIGTALGL